MQLGLDFNLVEDLVAGVDEVGRGPLCGPVVTAAVILDPSRPILGLNDSKKLSEARREALFEEIREKALAWCIARAEVEEIDRLNILHATMLAMQRAVEGLSVIPRLALIDGNRCPKLAVPCAPVVKGDSQVPAIAAASILAKVSRDREMVELDRVYPGYGMAGHKGYPTAVHLEALSRLGPTPIHRRSFAPVRELKPDVVLMDVKMPGIGGLEATRKLLRSQPDIKVVVVTVCEEDPFPTRLMQAGAAGYMTKGAGLEEMVQAIRQVFAGQRYISPQIAQQLALKSFQPQQHDSPFDSLSEREIQIALMIANCHKVQSISDKLCLSPKTVNTYRYRIFEKLSITSDVELALLAVRHGMVDAAS